MMSLYPLDPVASAVLRIALAWLLLASCCHKLRDLSAFRLSVIDYRIVPARLADLFAAGCVAAEAGSAAGLLLAPSLAFGALGAALLFSLYGAAIAINLRRGRHHIDCGCGGPAGRRTLSWSLVARNAALAAAAGACAAPIATRPLVWIDSLTIVAGVSALALLYAALDASTALAPRLRELRGRA